MDSANNWTRSRVKNLDTAFSGSPRAKSERWQLILERDVPNSDFLSKDEAVAENGEDTRTSRQKRRTRKEQLTKMYDGEPITKGKAEKLAIDFMNEENEKLVKANRPTISVPDYVDAFLKDWARNIEPSTLKSYRGQAKRIRAEFEGVALQELTGKQITEWINKMHRAGLSVSTQRKAYALLNLACNSAVKADDLEINPCTKADSPKTPKADPNALTDRSREKLFDLLEGMEPTPLCVAAYIGIYMGLREGEICGLQWKHIDYNAGMMNVCQAIGQAEGKKTTYLKATKNDSSTRLLPIPTPLLDVLKAREAKMRGELAQADISISDEDFNELFVIGYVDGRYKNGNLLGKEWHVLAETFDLVGTKGRLCTFHDIRHTFATVAVAEKLDVKTIASYLGHSDASMTLRIYADADENAKRAAADTMGKAYGRQ